MRQRPAQEAGPASDVYRQQPSTSRRAWRGSQL